MDASSRADQSTMRASDADRNQVAEILGDALASGRLTLDEHSERMDAVYQAKTFGDLEVLVRDLPLSEPLRHDGAGASGASGASGGPGDGESVAYTRSVFSKIRRRGQWVVPPHTTAVARFGAIVMDFRHAVFQQREVTLEAVSFCGKIEIYVPRNARVYDTGGALLGKRTLLGGAPSDPDGPVIHITGRSVLGHIRVMRSGRH